MEVLWKQFFVPQLWNGGLNLLVLVVAALYLSATGRWRSRFHGSSRVAPSRKILFLGGLLLFYLALGSPLAWIGHELFSVHMFQQSILYLVVPPLLIRGIPDWLWQVIWGWKGLDRFLRFGTKPLIALVWFNGLFSIYHIPAVFDALMGTHSLQWSAHFVLMAAAGLMWWPVLSPLPEYTLLTPLRKMAYIAAAGVLLTPACALIIFADHVLFASYTGGESVLSMMDPRDDQQMGGVIMKIMQEGIYGGMLGYVFIKWIRRDRDIYGVPDNREVPSPVRRGELVHNVSPRSSVEEAEKGMGGVPYERDVSRSSGST
ncbi:cytochrome c oxidase assembly protein [Desmospora profundinema]|uniref:Membrane protein n=1 Tax=Desmospora profundinema TaxID=1571184 RepID=A0ABU1IM49_9BACL|nr:cytochrome c oxidase assembly protein [Desmospora profundinema]MDR6225851.1 putative membrane protein [Desmospora profundinema]